VSTNCIIQIIKTCFTIISLSKNAPINAQPVALEKDFPENEALLRRHIAAYRR
jgi:hypothetical protein